MANNNSKRISRAPKLSSSDEYYLNWHSYEITDEEVFWERPEPVIENDPTLQIVGPLLKKYGHLHQCEIELIQAIWKVAHARTNCTYPQFLEKAGIISSFAASLLSSSAKDICNLECVFHKMSASGLLKIPGLIQCFLGRMQTPVSPC